MVYDATTGNNFKTISEMCFVCVTQSDCVVIKIMFISIYVYWVCSFTVSKRLIAPLFGGGKEKK